MWKEFKEFAMKGKVIDLAIGIIIGGAFQKIISSLVNDVIMQTISLFTGKVNFSDLAIQIGEVSIKYGSFLSTIIDFLAIAFSLFFFVKYINKINKKIGDMTEKELKKLEKKGLFKRAKKTAPAPTTKTCPYCYSEIDLRASKCPKCTSDLPKPEEI